MGEAFVALRKQRREHGGCVNAGEVLVNLSRVQTIYRMVDGMGSFIEFACDPDGSFSGYEVMETPEQILAKARGESNG